MNPFLSDYKTRLAAWKKCRAEIASQHDTVLQIDLCLQFWKQAPIQNNILNWDDCTVWPTSWEQLENNDYCTSSHSLAVANTLVLGDPSRYQNLSLRLITDRQNSVQKIVVYTQGWILNYGYLDKTSENSLQHVHTNNIWKWAGKQWYCK
jgi:hypothetical protein